MNEFGQVVIYTQVNFEVRQGFGQKLVVVWRAMTHQHEAQKLLDDFRRQNPNLPIVRAQFKVEPVDLDCGRPLPSNSIGVKAAK